MHQRAHLLTVFCFSKLSLPINALTLNTVCFKIYLYMHVYCVHTLYIHAIYGMCILYLQMMYI